VFKEAIVLSVCVQMSLGAQTLRERAKSYLDSALDAGQPFVVVSAASGMPIVAGDSLAAVLGQNLASVTMTGSSPFTLTLGGVSVQITDSAGVVQSAPLLYVSPGQINLLVPQGVAIGMATLSISNGSQSPITGTMDIELVAPGLFTANENGTGVVSATAYQTVISTSINSPVAVFQCPGALGSCVSVPLQLGVDVAIFLRVNATGLRGRTRGSAVQLTIAGQPVYILSIDALDDDDDFAGVDQLTFPIPLALRGSGEVNMVIAVDGTTSNAATINIQ
jgi:uncharacterized protein (TIGR03437 family)